MTAFIIRRLFQALIVLFITSVIVFAGVYAIGDPLEILLPADATMAERAQVTQSLGLDKPLIVQYAISCGMPCSGFSKYNGRAELFHRMASPIQAAQVLEGAPPLTAVLLRRTMISDTLDRAKSTRYRHTARHLAEYQSLHTVIADHQAFGDHDDFLASLQTQHRRKEGFWSRVPEFIGK